MTAVLAWRRQRLPFWVFGMLSLYLGLAASSDWTSMGVLLRALAAWCLVAALRIWDDIADRGVDAARDPHRVLVQVNDLRPFWGASAVLMVVGAMIVMGLRGCAGVSIVAVLMLSFGALYRAKVGLRSHWVLLKYPVLVAALGATHWHTAALVYCSFCIHERIDDLDLRQASGARLRLMPYLAASGGLAWCAVGGPGWWLVAWTLATGLSLVAMAQHRTRLAPSFLLFSLFVFGGPAHV